MLSILRRYRAGELSESEAERLLRRSQLEELAGQARLDLGRQARRGLPEVVLAAGKTPGDTARLTVRLAQEQGQGLASRLSADHWPELETAVGAAGLELHRHVNAARVLQPGFSPPTVDARIAVITAGTSDLSVAEEVRMLALAGGMECRLVADVGVAGLHRLVTPLSRLLEWEPDVIVVAAGMDGVLPGLVAGLTDRPVIGVPVSTGYGLGGSGEAALLTMLQSCSTGLVTVNLDNGIGAGAAAVLIAARAARRGAEAVERRQPPPPPVPQPPETATPQR
ncbi:MAG: nickel pincer cofactor biosynthesis protein LarB [Candidatus Dormibacteraeota bacterium]|nr:nickel pincer cofactor biosynthesis protein LarB [Candidatus Dormibacteraeota bacterium]